MLLTDLVTMLPKDVVDIIFAYDHHKRQIFDKVLHHLKMRLVWTELYDEYRIQNQFWKNKWCWSDLLYDIVLEEEQDYENYCQRLRLFHKIHGNRPRRFFDVGLENLFNMDPFL